MYSSDIEVFAKLVLACVVFAIAVYGICYGIQEYSCTQLSNMYGTQHKLILLDCYFFDEGNWVSESVFKVKQAFK